MTTPDTSQTETSSKQLTQNNKTSITFAIAQASFSVGDVDGNAKKISQLTNQAQQQGADVVIFPELALLGYPPQDLLLRPRLQATIKTAIDSLTRASDAVMLVGYPHIDHHGTFNSIGILHGGNQRGFYHKQCLPNHGVFDERRYFNKGRNRVLFDYSGITIGLLIGADIWQDEPIDALKEQGADVVVVINASPFSAGKQEQRRTVLQKQCDTHALPIIYANCVGGQDDLVFDGGSMAIQADGQIAHEAPRFLPKLMLVEFDTNNQRFDQQTSPPLTLDRHAECYQALVVGLRDYATDSGFKGVIVGLSGGVESALTLCIAVDALGADKVYAVMMPYEHTSQVSLDDAQAQAHRLNVSYTVCPIHDAVAGLGHTLAPLLGDTKPDNTEQNIQARARGTVLMALSDKFGHLVLNAGNKTELATGRATLYGDMVGGFGVLKDVYKSQVYDLVQYRNQLESTPVIVQRVIEQAPDIKLDSQLISSKQLKAIQKLDDIIRLYIDQDLEADDIIKQGFEREQVEQIIALIDANEYKRRQSAIGTKVSGRAFGRDRRYPIVNKWSPINE